MPPADNGDDSILRVPYIIMASELKQQQGMALFVV